MVRKTATPARARRIVRPAARVRLAKTRSPKRRLGDPAFASMVLTVWCALDSLRGDRVDDRLGLLGEGRRDRGRAGVVRRLLLALFADHIGQEALDERGLGLVVVGRAGDQVRRQHQRVGPGRGGGAVDLDGHVALGAAVVERGGFDGLGSTLGGGRGPGVADLDRGRLQVAHLAEVGVPDGALAATDRGDHAGGLVGALAGLDRPHLVGRVGPGAVAGLLEVVGEVLGGARLVGAVDRVDLGRRELGVGVVGLDGRVVPRLDLAGEDPGDGLGGEVELVDAFEVEDDGDRAHVVGDLDGVGAAALLRGVDLTLLGVERGVGPGEVDATGVELLDTGTRAGRVVVDGDAAVRLLEAGSPGVHGGLLGAGPGAVELAREVAGATAGVVGLVAGPTGGKSEAEGKGRCAGSSDAAKGSAVHFYS